MKKSLLLMAALLTGYCAMAQQTTVLLSKYDEVKEALVRSDSKAASAAIAALDAAVKQEAPFEGKVVLVTAVDKLTKAKSLEKQREAFAGVSTGLWTVVNAAAKVEQPVYYQYCPMKKAYWISKEAAIRNPYYGASMLSCGKVEATKK